MMRVSVIVPTYNRASRLQRLLDALERQNVGMDSFEVVVCDDGSSDNTPDVLAAARPYAVTVLRRKNGGPAAARNDAIRTATGELLVFIDDDVEPEPDAVRLHAEAHEHDGSLVVLGAMHAHTDVRTPWIAWESRTLARQYEAMTKGEYAPTARQFFTANASVRREHVVSAGMFDEAFRRAEDIELAFRLESMGLRFAFRPGIRVWHDPDRSLAAWKRIARQYGDCDVLMWRAGRKEDLLRYVAREFRMRQPSVRAVARATVGRGPVLAAFAAVAMSGARLAYAARLERAAIGLCSLVFNAEYYHGMAGALGGRAAFWRAIDHPEPEPAPSPRSDAPLASMNSSGGTQ